MELNREKIQVQKILSQVNEINKLAMKEISIKKAHIHLKGAKSLLDEKIIHESNNEFLTALMTTLNNQACLYEK